MCRKNPDYHVDAAMRELIGKRPWLTVFRFPTYTPTSIRPGVVWAHRRRACAQTTGLIRP
ncbi:hypothetical protein GCM10010256_32660 [Streptomyces coeruleorubidus]|nr:hypothetical protein GCM10010256_32660 [Streptomyces coeruleorubidus]